MMPTRSPRLRYKAASLSTSEDFPAPGAPVIPTIKARPVRGKICFIRSEESDAPPSTFEIALATAVVSPAVILSIKRELMDHLHLQPTRPRNI